jgi:hypothetical protein
MGDCRTENRAAPVDEGHVDIAQTGEPDDVTGRG